MQDKQPADRVQSFLDFVKNYFGALVSVSGIPVVRQNFSRDQKQGGSW